MNERIQGVDVYGGNRQKCRIFTGAGHGPVRSKAGKVALGCLFAILVVWCTALIVTGLL